MADIPNTNEITTSAAKEGNEMGTQHAKTLITALLRERLGFGELGDREVDRFERFDDATVPFGPDVTAYVEKRYHQSLFTVSLNWRSSSAHASTAEAREMGHNLAEAMTFAGLVTAILDCNGGGE